MSVLRLSDSKVANLVDSSHLECDHEHHEGWLVPMGVDWTQNFDVMPERLQLQVVVRPTTSEDYDGATPQNNARHPDGDHLDWIEPTIALPQITSLHIGLRAVMDPEGDGIDDPNHANAGELPLARIFSVSDSTCKDRQLLTHSHNHTHGPSVCASDWRFPDQSPVCEFDDFLGMAGLQWM